MKVEEVTRVGIVGAGTMGSRIAFQCILNGKAVYLFDVSKKALDQAMKMNREWVTDRAEPQYVSNALSNLHQCVSLKECLRDVELIIETVPEILELKRQVFAEIDRLTPRDVLIGTNSSSIPSSRLAGATSRPNKVFNINFTDPLHESLVEIMGNPETSREAIAMAERFVYSIKMVPIITKREIMGFTFNRIWRAIKREALHLIGDGYAEFEDIDRAWILLFGTALGPFALMDQIGLDVVRDIEMQYYLDSGDERDKPPEFLDVLVSQDRLGVKEGKGFYTYPNPEYEHPGWLRKEAPWTPDKKIRID